MATTQSIVIAAGLELLRRNALFQQLEASQLQTLKRAAVPCLAVSDAMEHGADWLPVAAGLWVP